jgi:hypothetical protein
MAPVLRILGAIVFVSHQSRLVRRSYKHNEVRATSDLPRNDLLNGGTGVGPTNNTTSVVPSSSIQQVLAPASETSDTLEDFERDISKVLRVLRPHRYDPNVPGSCRALCIAIAPFSHARI